MEKFNNIHVVLAGSLNVYVLLYYIIINISYLDAK